MGIPAGKMVENKIGYKKTAFIALAIGTIGLMLAYSSSSSQVSLVSLSSGFSAFISSVHSSQVSAVCILNTVVNPMLNLLGGGGNRGNQLNLRLVVH